MDELHFDVKFVVRRIVSWIDRGIPLVWTKCDMDMPDDQSFMVEGEGTGDYPSGVSGGDWLAVHAQRQ